MVLDVGAGFGASLSEEFDRRQPGQTTAQQVLFVGIDIDWQTLRTAKSIHPQFSFVLARGEQIPFREHCFAEVISRVAMPYMDIPATLREIRRVLIPGGEVRMKLHPVSYTWSELIRELKSGSLRQRLQNLVYRLYVIANGLTLHAAGCNFRFGRRCESFQTKRAIHRALVTAGFQDIDSSCWVTSIVPPHAGNCRITAKSLPQR